MYAQAALRIAPRAARAVAPDVTFEEVVARFQDEVFGAALRILGDAEAAADATSATFLKAYRGFARYEPGRPLRNWLLTIAVREALSEGRRRTRERAHREPAEADERWDVAAQPATPLALLVATVVAILHERRSESVHA